MVRSYSGDLNVSETRREMNVANETMREGSGGSSSAAIGAQTVSSLALKLQIPIAVARLEKGKIVELLKDPW